MDTLKFSIEQNVWIMPGTHFRVNLVYTEYFVSLSMLKGLGGAPIVLGKPRNKVSFKKKKEERREIILVS